MNDFDEFRKQAEAKMYQLEVKLDELRDRINQENSPFKPTYHHTLDRLELDHAATKAKLQALLDQSEDRFNNHRYDIQSKLQELQTNVEQFWTNKRY